MNRPLNPSLNERILLVGEGDFSLSVALQKQLLGARVISSSLLSKDEISLHKLAQENIDTLTKNNVQVLFQVDATKVHTDSRLCDKKFKRIIFNFPHIGGKSNVKKNRQLLKDFFFSAEKILDDTGEILVTLCKGQGGTPADKPMRSWQDSWQVVSMATYARLILADIVKFQAEDYPEYSSTGFRSQDKHFNTEGAITHIFRKCVPVIKDPTPTSAVGYIMYNGSRYKINHYIADKVQKSDNLHQSKTHPVSIVKKKIFEELQKKMETDIEWYPQTLCVVQEKDALQNPDSNDRYWLSKVDTCKKCSAEIQHGNNTEDYCQCKTQGFASVPSYQNTTNLCLRKTLLGQVSNVVIVDPKKMYLVAGTSYKKCTIQKNSLPVTNELMGVLKLGSKNDDILENVASKIKSAVKEMIPISSCVELDTAKSNECSHAGYDASDCWSLLAIRTNNDDGQQNVKTMKKNRSTIDSSKAAERRECENKSEANNEMNMDKSTIGHVAWLGGDQEMKLVFILDLDAVVQICCDIPDRRLIWTEREDFTLQFSDWDTSTTFTYQPLSLYPPTWCHDVSFWEKEGERFDEETFCDIVRDYAGDSVFSVSLVDTYIDTESNRVSKCYREVFQPCDLPLSYHQSHDLQKKIRLKAAEVMNITLR